MTEQTNIWHWQEPGDAWHGCGIYHITLTQAERDVPRLGALEIPDDDPERARVIPSDLGRRIIHALQSTSSYHPEVKIIAYQIMPDHIHAVLHVTRTMPVGIMGVVRGFWQGCKRCYREWASKKLSSITPDSIRHNQQYPHLPANLFEQMPVVVTMSHRGHLATMVNYVHDNPRRLALKRLHPGLFRVMRGVSIAGATYDAVGNILLLNATTAQTIHVRKEWVMLADGKCREGGDEEPLRNYKNGCVQEARKGVLSISPFISPHEQQVRDVLIREGHPIIYLVDNGFTQYYKPSAPWGDAVAAGRVLILAPTTYDPDHVLTREQCVRLNAQAAKIAEALTSRGRTSLSPIASKSLSSITPDSIRHNNNAMP